MKQHALLSLALVIGLLGSASLVSKPWVTIQQAEPILVKGYAEKAVRADQGSLTIYLSERGDSGAAAYKASGRTLQIVQKKIEELLGSESEIVELGTSVNESRKLNDKGNYTDEIDYYTASRSLRVNTERVEELSRLARRLYDLNAEGIRLNLDGPSFFVSSLEEVKAELMEKATINGRNRAEIMATSSGEKLGSLVSARQGVIQITKPNSTATSSYGTYDTETIDKVVKLVVTVEFKIGH